jgi:hypothetical protein
MPGIKQRHFKTSCYFFWYAKFKVIDRWIRKFRHPSYWLLNFLALKKFIAFISNLPNEKSKRVSTDRQSERLDILYFVKAPMQNCVQRLLAASCLSVPLDGFSWKLVLEYFSKFGTESSDFIKIWQENPVLYITAYVHLWQYLAQFFWEWEMFQTKLYRKSKHTFLVNNFFPKIVLFMRYGKIW